jgi:DNA-binding protein
MDATAGVVMIKEHTVMARTIPYCDTQLSTPDFQQLTLVAEGKAVNKCISILEILKRTHTGITSSITLDASPRTPDEPRLTVVLTP